MFSLAILLVVIAILAISFHVPEMVLSPASISGALMVAFLVFLAVGRIVFIFRRPHPLAVPTARRVGVAQTC